MTFEEYEKRMMMLDPYIRTMYDKGDGYCLIVKRLLFHWTLLQSEIGDFEQYDDRWCYQTDAGAEDAVKEWRSRGWEGEPTGWHRHPKTSRRRTDGDPAREYVEA